MPDQQAVPEEPFELSDIRTVTIIASDSGSWKIELDYPEWLSPYEVFGMLSEAIRKVERELEELNDEDGSED